MKSFNSRRAAATLGCAAALAGSALVGAPGAAAHAPGAQACGSRTIAVHAGGKTTHVAVSRIRAEGGATCKVAIAVIRGVVTKKLPRGWSVSEGNFKVPHGLTAQIAVKGKMKVKFALPGPGA
jgi:hypothetical protein